jgi:hypothetical protein
MRQILTPERHIIKGELEEVPKGMVRGNLAGRKPRQFNFKPMEEKEN